MPGITVAAAETLSRLNPRIMFIYVSGAGTDSSESGRVTCARVSPCMAFAPRRQAYRVFYSLTKPLLLPLLRDS